MLLKLLAPHIDDSDVTVRSNFSLRRPRTGLKWGPGALYCGGAILRRSKRLDDLVSDLLRHLGSLVPPSEGCAYVPARVLIRDDRAVLVAAPHYMEIVDERHGVDELPCWQAWIDPRRRAVLVPAELATNDRRRRIGIDRPTVPLVGVIGPETETGEVDLPLLWIRSRGSLDDWGLVLDRFDHERRVRPAGDTTQIRRSIDELLRLDP